MTTGERGTLPIHVRQRPTKPHNTFASFDQKFNLPNLLDTNKPAELSSSSSRSSVDGTPSRGASSTSDTASMYSSDSAVPSLARPEPVYVRGGWLQLVRSRWRGRIGARSRPASTSNTRDGVIPSSDIFVVPPTCCISYRYLSIPYLPLYLYQYARVIVSTYVSITQILFR